MTVLLIAPVIGIAFGWFLERGGLGSASKLAGQFYLRDMTVFRVMFSALLTAMLGVFWLEYFGVLNGSVIDIPATFPVPQSLGGAVFGAGFLMAGLCPGTACVALASGQANGGAVMVGILSGVVLFNAGFHWIARVYEMTPMGVITLPEWLGLPQGVVVAGVSVIALAGFAAATWLERRYR